MKTPTTAPAFIHHAICRPEFWQGYAKLEHRMLGTPCLVTTVHRGVFFGYCAADQNIDTGDTLTLQRGRLCLHWDAACKGFMGLAAFGPTAGCRIGPQADIRLRNITAVALCTPEAVVAWEKAPWSET
jgi:hypothetical protein